MFLGLWKSPKLGFGLEIESKFFKETIKILFRIDRMGIVNAYKSYVCMYDLVCVSLEELP